LWGYLLPGLVSVGRTQALVLVSLVWAAWYMPLILLTPPYHPGDNWLIVAPHILGTIVAGSFVSGYPRIYTGSGGPPP
jgi:uncharacterized protein